MGKQASTTRTMVAGQQAQQPSTAALCCTRRTSTARTHSG